jgi:PmbA protein
MTAFAFDAEALLEKAAKLGCEQAEVYESGVVTTPVNFENNQLKSIETAETAIAAVRVVKGGRLGFATSSKAGDDNVVDMAARGAEFGPEATFDFAAASPVAQDLKVYDPAVADWPQERMLAIGEEVVDHIRAFEDGVLGSATVEKHIAYNRLATSKGQNVYADGTAYVVFAGGELVEPENMIHVWSFMAGRRLDFDLEALKTRLATMYRRARKNVPFRGGKFPVVFAPMAAADLVSPMLACADGMAVVKGESPWRDRAGEKLFAESFSLYDDPSLPWGLRTTPFDDEGTPTSRRAIIENGVLRDFFVDRRSGKALGRESTGNGYRASPQALPVPRPSNVVVPPGKTPLAGIVAGIKEGLYVERLMGAWAGNPYAGQVSGNVHIGFKIENGEITGRVKDCMVSVSVFEAFRHSLAALSRETEDIPVGLKFPFILLDGMSVSTKA